MGVNDVVGIFGVFGVFGAIGDMDTDNKWVAGFAGFAGFAGIAGIAGIADIEVEVDLVDIDGVVRLCSFVRSWYDSYILFIEYKKCIQFFYTFIYLIVKIRAVADRHSAIVLGRLLVIDRCVDVHLAGLLD